MKIGIALVVWLLICSVGRAEIPSPADEAFEKGRALLDAGSYAEACAAFEPTFVTPPATIVSAMPIVDAMPAADRAAPADAAPPAAAAGSASEDLAIEIEPAAGPEKSSGSPAAPPQKRKPPPKATTHELGKSRF